MSHTLYLGHTDTPDSLGLIMVAYAVLRHIFCPYFACLFLFACDSALSNPFHALYEAILYHVYLALVNPYRTQVTYLLSRHSVVLRISDSLSLLYFFFAPRSIPQACARCSNITLLALDGLPLYSSAVQARHALHGYDIILHVVFSAEPILTCL